MLGRFIAIFATAVVAVALLSAIAHADDNFSTAYDVPQCVDPNSDVVGYRACPQYGSWGENLLAPYVFVEIGANLWHFTGPATSPQATARSSTGTAASTGTSPSAATNSIRENSRMLTYDERVGVGLPLGLYIAVDFELGAYSDGNSPASSGLIALASGGWHHRFGRLTLAAELSGGVRAFSPDNEPSLTTDAMFLVRGRAQIWLTPWFTIGGSGGASLLSDGGWVAGFELGFHTRSYGRH